MKTPDTTPVAANEEPPAISPEVGEACARLLMADSRIHEIIDEYPHGRYILSALNGRFGYKYPCSETAQRDLLAALGHWQFTTVPHAGNGTDDIMRQHLREGGSPCS